jgi:hypothetical protein
MDVAPHTQNSEEKPKEQGTDPSDVRTRDRMGTNMGGVASALRVLR